MRRNIGVTFVILLNSINIVFLTFNILFFILQILHLQLNIPDIFFPTFVPILYLVVGLINYFALGLTGHLSDMPGGIATQILDLQDKILPIFSLLAMLITICLLTYGIYKLKKWAYKITLNLGLISLLIFLFSFAIWKTFDIYSFSLLLSALILFFNKKRFVL